jgi:hypothetical protein
MQRIIFPHVAGDTIVKTEAPFGTKEKGRKSEGLSFGGKELSAHDLERRKPHEPFMRKGIEACTFAGKEK